MGMPRLNVAVTARLSDMVTTQSPFESTASQPVQPMKTELPPGCGVSRTEPPAVMFAAQLAWKGVQGAMPDGLLDTVPCPSPALVKVRM